MLIRRRDVSVSPDEVAFINLKCQLAASKDENRRLQLAADENRRLLENQRAECANLRAECAGVKAVAAAELRNLNIRYTRAVASVVEQERAKAQQRVEEEREHWVEVLHEDLQQAEDEYQSREEALLAALETKPLVEKLVLEHKRAVEEPIDEDLEQEDACIICWVRPRTHVLIPCGHVQMCGECSKDYHPSTVRQGYKCHTECPYCKAEVLLPSVKCR